jgi:hypothetical protein
VEIFCYGVEQTPAQKNFDVVIVVVVVVTTKGMTTGQLTKLLQTNDNDMDEGISSLMMTP